METWKRLIAARGEGGGGQWWKEGEGTSQRTHMKEQWTCTMMWGLTVMGCGLGGAGQRGKNWDNYNRVTILKI